MERELKAWEIGLDGFDNGSGRGLVLYLIAIQRGVWKGYEDFVIFEQSLSQSLVSLTPNVNIRILKLPQSSPFLPGQQPTPVLGYLKFSAPLITSTSRLSYLALPAPSSCPLLPTQQPYPGSVYRV